MIDLTALAPPLLHALVARSLYGTRLFNVTITNVPGPQTRCTRSVPRYARTTRGSARGRTHGRDRDISYNGGRRARPQRDCDSTPDLHVLAEGVEQGFAELRD